MSSPRKGPGFEAEVAQLLRLKGYEVSQNELISGTQIDLLARRNDMLDNTCLIVECGDRSRPVGVELIKQKSAVLLTLRDPRYMFRLLYVSRKGFTAEAKAYADEHSAIQLMTFDQLEEQLVNFTPYTNAYCYAYEHNEGMFREANIFGQFVEPAAKDERGELLADLSQETRFWLEDKSNNVLFLLGEYGSGKTSFCRQLAYDLIKERDTKGPGPGTYLPLLFNLREYRKSFNVQQLVTDTLINQYGVSLASFHAFERACDTGRILLILDGFDEMAARSDDRTIVDCFSQLFVLAALNAKVLLTCRTNFFSSHADLLQLIRKFSIEVPDPEVGDTILISFEHHGRMLTLEPWDDNRILQFIESRSGDQAEGILTSIKQVHDLSDLSSRPVLLNMIVKTLPELLNAQSPLNSAALYEHYTTKWTSRDDWRVNSPSKLRQVFCETLASVMHRANVTSIAFPMLERVMTATLKSFTKSDQDLEHLKSDIQTCSFLTRSTGDEFRFAHKSFVEFFTARRAVDALLDRANDMRPTEAEVDSIAIGDKEGKGPRLRDPSGNLVLITPSWGSAFFSESEQEFATFFSLRSSMLRRMDIGASLLSFNQGYVAGHFTTATNAAIEASLEHHAKLLFKDLDSPSAKLMDSPEIATFAIEYIAFLRIPIEECLKAARTKVNADVLSGVLRNALPNDYIRQNVPNIKRFVSAKSDEDMDIVRASLCTALAKTPDAIDYEFVVKARSVLSSAAWRYLLFEIASVEGHSKILHRVLELDNLALMDRAIAIFGTRNSIGPSALQVAIFELAQQLAITNDESEQLAGIELLSLLNFSDEYLLELYADLLSSKSSAMIRRIAAELLGSLSSEKAWRGVRGLWAKESDSYLRGKLQEAERKIREQTSRKKNRQTWAHGGRRRAVRDRMWAALRS